MKAVIVAAVAMIFVAFVHTGEAIQCPPQNEALVTLIPNPEDCKTFYACNNGIPYLMHCMDGLEFNPIEKVCDWPEHANCMKNPSSTAAPPPTDATTESPATPSTTQPANTEPAEVTTEGPWD